MFHPAVEAWFRKTFAAPTEAQARAWPAIQAGPPCPRRGADRLGQDAGRVPRGDRRSRAPRRRRRVAGRNLRRLRLAAEGALQRHPAQSRSAARGHSRRARSAGLSGRRNPHARAHRRYAAERAREHAAPATAHRRHHARVALCAARLRFRTHDARDHAHRDRRRNPRARAEQARQPSRAFARAPCRIDSSTSGACGLVRNAEADRGSRALSRGHGGAGHGLHHRRYRTRARARPRARGSAVPARSRHVGRCLAAGLPAACRAHARASHHARLRQHAAHGRARGAPPVRADRQGTRHRAPRQPGQGAAPSSPSSA